MEKALADKFSGQGKALPETLQIDHVSAATRLLEKRRQMFEVQEALNSQKEEFTRREDAFRRREEALRRKDLELQESLIKFNKFLQENETKKNRALKRAADERRQRELKEIDIKKLEQKLFEIANEEQALKAELEKNLKYQEYLESVASTHSKFFPELSDILKRYHVLQNCNVDLVEKSKTGEQLTEQTLRDFIQYRKEKENAILTDSNAISTLQVSFEHQQTSTGSLQSALDYETKGAMDKSVNLGQVLTSVANILERADTSFRIRHNKPLIDHAAEQLEQIGMRERCIRAMSKLEEIQMFLGDYSDIHKEYILETSKSHGATGKVSVVATLSIAGEKSEASSK